MAVNRWLEMVSNDREGVSAESAKGDMLWNVRRGSCSPPPPNFMLTFVFSDQLHILPTLVESRGRAKLHEASYYRRQKLAQLTTVFCKRRLHTVSLNPIADNKS
jgi:hypothetical protein